MSGKPERRPPNVVMTIADDQRFDLLGAAGCYPQLETPAQEALAGRGTNFAHAFHVGSTRAALCAANPPMPTITTGAPPRCSPSRPCGLGMRPGFRTEGRRWRGFMRKIVTAIVVALIVLEASVAAAGEAKLPLRNGSRVLYIGNSLTGGGPGGIGGYVEAALEAGYLPESPLAGTHLPDIHTRRLSKWGKGLDVHYAVENYVSDKSNPDYYTDLPDKKLNAIQQIRAGLDGEPWDVVVLQGWRFDSDEDPRELFNYVRRFDQVIRQANAQTVLMMRWPVNPNEKHRKYSRAQGQRLIENYTRIGRELGAPVVPLCVIWTSLSQNPPRPDLGPSFLWGDLVHQNEIGKAVNAYTFAAVFSRRSPVGLRLSYRGYDETEDPGLDRALEERVWKVLRERKPWAGNPDYRPPPASGSASATYDPADGSVRITIRGEASGVRFGSPGFGLGKGLLRESAAKVGGAGPVQSDTEIIAWYDPDGLEPGSYDLGPLVKPGSPAEDLLLSCTPREGPSATGLVGLRR